MSFDYAHHIYDRLRCVQMLGEWDHVTRMLRAEWLEEYGVLPHITADEEYMTAYDAYLLGKTDLCVFVADALLCLFSLVFISSA